jgi:hypothetical protein
MRSAKVAASLLLLGLTSAAAQEPWITINQPRQWSANELYTVPAGTRVRLIGQAYHPQGIQSVTVAGQQATLRRLETGIVDFEATVTATRGTSVIRVNVQSLGGSAFPKDLRLAVSPEAGAALPTVAPQAPSSKIYSPGGAAVRSLLVPGLGQFYTGKPVLGVVFLAATGAAIGVALGSKEITGLCMSPLSGGDCPSDQIWSQSTSRPLLVPGLAGAGAIAIIAALEARSAAKKKNAQGTGGGDDSPDFSFWTDARAVGVKFQLRF